MNADNDAEEQELTAPESVQGLPAWALRALQKPASMAAPTPPSASDARSKAEWPLLVDAALVASFLPRDLAPSVLSGGARAAAEKAVLEFAQVTHGAAGTQWSLTDAARQSVLNTSIASSARELQAAIDRTAERFKDPVSSALRSWLADHGQIRDAKPQNAPSKIKDVAFAKPAPQPPGEAPVVDELRALEARRAALALLEGVKLPAAPALQTLDREIGHRRLLRQFERMTGEAPTEEHAQQRNHFYGRAHELEVLRGYVAEVAADTLGQTVIRVANSLLRARKPVALWGIGGVGKTTLLAKFMLEHARAAISRFPFAYLDFDRSIISGRNPAALLAEICAQVSTQFEALAAPLTGLQHQAEELAKRATNEKFVPEISSALRELLRHFREHIEQHLQDLEHRFAARRPFLLVLDTFESVQYSPDQVQVIDSFVRGFSRSDESGLWPRLRLVISGRQEIRYLGGEVVPVPLGALDPRGSRDMLLELARMAHKPIPAHLAEALVQALAIASGGKRSDGVLPLRLRILGEVFQQDREPSGPVLVQALLRELQSPPSEAGLAGRMLIDGILVRRVLDHVRDARVRALADPGLVVRHINRDVIRFVMVPATPDPAKTREDVGDLESFDTWQVDTEQAEDIFAAMRRELSLVEPDGNDLRHRQDVRREMLPLIAARRPKRFRRVHQLAFEYFVRAARANPSNQVAAAEAIYHGLWLNQPYAVLDALWVDDPVFDPRIDADEFPAGGAANVYMRARLSRPLTAPEAASLARPLALHWLGAQLPSFLEEASPTAQIDLIRAATSPVYEGIAGQPRHAATTARLLYRAGLWRDAMWLTQHALEHQRSTNHGPPHEQGDAVLSLVRTFGTLVTKSQAERRPDLPRELAQPQADPVVHVELLMHSGMHLLTWNDPDARLMFDIAAGHGSEIGRSTWRMYLRVLRLLALTSGDDATPMALYVSFGDKMPREREVRDDVRHLMATVVGTKELQRLHAHLDSSKATPLSALDEMDALWREARERLASRLMEDQELLRLAHRIVTVEHHDWRHVIASALTNGMRGESTLRSALGSFAEPRSKGASPDGAAIVHGAVSEGRFLELTHLLASLRPTAPDDTPALTGHESYRSLAAYPNSASALARALLSWQRRLLTLRPSPNVGTELA